MERSVKFISLSGLSGILAGIYALIGAAIAYYLVHYPISPFAYHIYPIQSPEVLMQLTGVAAVVLASSLLTGFWLSARKAKRAGVKIWDVTSKRLFINLSVPLITGGNFEASMTTRLSGGAGCGNVARPSTRTNLPSCAETMMSAAMTGMAAINPKPNTTYSDDLALRMTPPLLASFISGRLNSTPVCNARELDWPPWYDPIAVQEKEINAPESAAHWTALAPPG